MLSHLPRYCHAASATIPIEVMRWQTLASIYLCAFVW